MVPPAGSRQMRAPGTVEQSLPAGNQQGDHSNVGQRLRGGAGAHTEDESARTSGTGAAVDRAKSRDSRAGPCLDIQVSDEPETASRLWSAGDAAMGAL